MGLLEWMVGSIDLKVEVAPRERCGAVVIRREPLYENDRFRVGL